ncbi:LolA family protein [Oceanobacillus piezotolerans]|uniref:LolA family protein n=1 Tax=Oceanobacillus piezotolerans TaxID=2448030 RepID=UPI0013146DF2|nr:DUF2092 domain-containing protein [Oceanobacillus piezotolerans]
MKKVLALLSITALLLGGCSMDMNVSAEEIIHNAIESEKDIGSYYGKSEMKLFEGEELINEFSIEEFVAEDGKKKLITQDKILDQKSTALNIDNKLTVYDEATGQVFEMGTEEMAGLASMSPKEQFKNMMENMKSTHDYEMVGEDKVLDFDVFHIKMTTKEKDNLIGDMELWIDQKTWFVVKMKTEIGDSKSEVQYTTLDYSPEFAEDTFTMEIPENAEKVDLEEDFGPSSVSIEEAEEAMGQSFLVFPEEEIKLTDVQLYPYSEQLQRSEIDLQYSSAEDIPMFSLSVFPTPEDMPIAEGDRKIRGNNAEYDKMINGISWDENGLRYNLLITNPDIAIEDIEKLTDEMVLSSEQ